MAKKKIYIGKITKGKRKGKTGFVTQKDWLKQNNENILSGEIRLTESESKVFKRVQKSGSRLRYKGRFLNKEQQKYILKTLGDLGEEVNQTNINFWFEKELFFTIRSFEMSDALSNHKGIIQLNKIPFELSEAILEFDKLNAENYQEWSDILEIDKSAIFFIIYDALYTPINKTLNIITMIKDESRIVTSDPEIKAKRKAEKLANKLKDNPE